MAHPKRFELLTPRFVVWCSIQLSYGCVQGRRTYAGARPKASRTPEVRAGASPGPAKTAKSFRLRRKISPESVISHPCLGTQRWLRVAGGPAEPLLWRGMAMGRPLPSGRQPVARRAAHEGNFGSGAEIASCQRVDAHRGFWP